MIRIGAVLAALGLSISAIAEETRPTYPNVLGIEVLGRGLLYSVTYDRVLGDSMAAGFAFGTTNTQFPGGATADRTAQLIPAYANYYFSKEESSLVATAGFTLVLNTSSVRGLESATSGVVFSDSVMPVFGLGYENRSDQGFLFRATGYAILSNSEIKPWAGIHFGYAF